MYLLVHTFLFKIMQYTLELSTDETKMRALIYVHKVIYTCTKSLLAFQDGFQDNIQHGQLNWNWRQEMLWKPRDFSLLEFPPSNILPRLYDTYLEIALLPRRRTQGPETAEWMTTSLMWRISQALVSYADLQMLSLWTANY